MPCGHDFFIDKTTSAWRMLAACRSSIGDRLLKAKSPAYKNKEDRCQPPTRSAALHWRLPSACFISENKLDMLIVPHEGVNQATIALLGGQVDMVEVGVATSAPHVRAGKLRALATPTTDRTDTFPDVPTIVEAGLPWFTVDTWYVLMAPAGTPPEIINRLNAEFTKMVKSPGTRKQLAGRGAEPVTSTPEEADRFIKSETERWAKVVREAGAKAN